LTRCRRFFHVVVVDGGLVVGKPPSWLQVLVLLVLMLLVW
jgi:hypothetical protein